MEQTAFRLPKEMLDRIDRYAEMLASNTPGLAVGRNAAVRILIAHALEALGVPEGDASKPAAKGRRKARR